MPPTTEPKPMSVAQRRRVFVEHLHAAMGMLDRCNLYGPMSPDRAILTSLVEYLESPSAAKEDPPDSVLPLNHMSRGMWPLNYASRLVKDSSDAMFHISTNDKASLLVCLSAIEKSVRELRALLLTERFNHHE